MSTDREIEKNRLFLVCPSGFMEPYIRKKFKGDSYFYTGIGIFFNWDNATQRDLIGLLKRKGIAEIHFVANIDNPTYNGCLPNSMLPLWPPEKSQIAPSTTNQKTEIKESLSTKGKTQLLLANHLARQIIRLKESSCLGKHIGEEAIQVSAFIYDSSDDSVLNTYEIDLQSMLLQGFCSN